MDPHYPRHPRKRRVRKVRVLLAASVLLFLAAASMLAWSAAGSSPAPVAPQEGSTQTAQQTSEDSAAASSQAVLPKSSVESLPSEAGSEPILETDAKPTSQEYDFSQPVPEATPVERSYLEDAVFIGDSRTEGFILYNGLSETTAYTHKGLMVDTVFTSQAVTLDGQKYTVMDALAKTNFSKVYIMLGINETGWAYSNLFIEKYGEIIDKIREINPDALIYVQSILPVSNEVSSSHDYLKNSKIDEYNNLIRQMAEEKQVYYLDVASAVAGSDGALPADAATDGIHLKKEYCQTWLDYLLAHTAGSIISE